MVWQKHLNVYNHPVPRIFVSYRVLINDVGVGDRPPPSLK